MSGSLTDLFDEDKFERGLVIERIRQRRKQMLIHSCIYYELNDNVVSDHKWQEWAEELAKLQNDHPDCCKIHYYDDAFKDWDGTTGAMLPYREAGIFANARWLLNFHKEKVQNS